MGISMDLHVFEPTDPPVKFGKLAGYCPDCGMMLMKEETTCPKCGSTGKPGKKPPEQKDLLKAIGYTAMTQNTNRIWNRY